MVRTVLLVEDDADDAFFTERALQTVGIFEKIAHVKNGEHAVHYLSGLPPFVDRIAHPLPDLILLDLRLPQYTGFDVLNWLRDRPDLAHIPVVVLTGSIYPEDETKARRLGAVAYQNKPIDFSALRSIAASLTSANPKPGH